MNGFRPIISVDFDGVIHSYTSGWKGADVVPDPPVTGAIEWLHKMLNSGFKVAIYSSRSSQKGGIDAMRDFIKNNAGSYFHTHPVGNKVIVGLDELEYPETKPPAFLTIDDRAFLFTGVFPDPEFVRSFKPWNK
jgi:hypothetical protein